MSTDTQKVTVILLRSPSDAKQLAVEDGLVAKITTRCAEIKDKANTPLVFDTLDGYNQYFGGLTSIEQANIFVLVSNSPTAVFESKPNFWPFAKGFSPSNKFAAKHVRALPNTPQGIYLSPGILLAPQARQEGLADTILAWITKRYVSSLDGLIKEDGGWSWTDALGNAMYPWGPAPTSVRRKKIRKSKNPSSGNKSSGSGWLGLRSPKKSTGHQVFRDRGDIEPHPHDG